MQTFLPFPSFANSLNILDKRRLNKQNLESTQILNVLLERTSNGKLATGWINHPAVKMWRGYENALKLYKNIGMSLAAKRGVKYIKLQLEQTYDVEHILNPPFFGNPEFHDSHLANLKRKALADMDAEYPELKDNMIALLGINYFNAIDETLPYVWPE